MPDLLAEVKGIYVNFERDTVYFGRRGDFYELLASTKLGVVKGLDQVRTLAVRGSKWGDVRRWDFDALKGLEDIVLVAQDGGKRRFDLGREPTLVKGDPNTYERFEMLDNLVRNFSEGSFPYSDRFASLTVVFTVSGS